MENGVVGELHERSVPGMIATSGFPSQPLQSSCRKGSWYLLQKMSRRASSKDRMARSCLVTLWESEAGNVLASEHPQTWRQGEYGERCVVGMEDILFGPEPDT